MAKRHDIGTETPRKQTRGSLSHTHSRLSPPSCQSNPQGLTHLNTFNIFHGQTSSFCSFFLVSSLPPSPLYSLTISLLWIQTPSSKYQALINPSCFSLPLLCFMTTTSFTELLSMDSFSWPSSSPSSEIPKFKSTPPPSLPLSPSPLSPSSYFASGLFSPTQFLASPLFPNVSFYVYTSFFISCFLFWVISDFVFFLFRLLVLLRRLIRRRRNRNRSWTSPSKHNPSRPLFWNILTPCFNRWVMFFFCSNNGWPLTRH